MKECHWCPAPHQLRLIRPGRVDESRSVSPRYRLTRIVVDNEAGPYKNHTVVFLGSEKGIILKFLANMNNGFLNDSVFLEELNVYNPDKYVCVCACVFACMK